MVTGRGGTMHIARETAIAWDPCDGWAVAYHDPDDGNHGRRWAADYLANSIEEAEAELPWSMCAKCVAAWKQEHTEAAEHTVTTREDRDRRGRRIYVGSCTCGWYERRRDPLLLMDKRDGHLRRIAREKQRQPSPGDGPTETSTP